MGLQLEPSFVQEAEHRPEPTISDAGAIPLVDLSSPPPTLIADIEAACRDWGFFQVVSHGVPLELLEGVQSMAKEFFSLPLEEKKRVQRDEENPVGYYDTERTQEVRDWKEVFDFTVKETFHIPVTEEDGRVRWREVRNQWPEHPPGMREACKEYRKAMEDLSFRLLELIALTLKLPPNRFNEFFKDTTSFIRLNHYPPCPSPDLALGVGRHKDAGALTVLAQDDVEGLDVKRKSDGKWVRVKPIPNSYIINIGDMVQVWSNDKYESPEHRVSVNSEKERFSIPFFFNPAYYTNIKPLDDLITEENPARYDEFNWGEFFMGRSNSNFKKLGVENTQIHHFKKKV
ncbi:probable 2-oxoglutarate-dependent dioxygenase At5g05600 [Asparagus officinalis]|uniref:probable 2-oxoglutarate-dependent dioxygenase At5g05600 n=1 Tax=Asparagus officinalis TaxID=4686 RepID=UPI00098E2EFA|nr:probable 2-oxoglutarate-dependent dioxygenase At5g05600 [Asparagus officinalis]